jgi:hypothetical protein
MTSKPQGEELHSTADHRLILKFSSLPLNHSGHCDIVPDASYLILPDGHLRVQNSHSDSGSTESLHFRRLPKCLQVADGATNLGDCKPWGVLSLKTSLGKTGDLNTLR